MVKVSRLGFDVDRTAGETPFRVYSSNEPVKDHMFVVMSKILADTNVYFELHACNIHTGETTKRLSRTTGMEKFLQSISILEADLKKESPTVQMIHQAATKGTGFALKKDGTVQTGVTPEEVMGAEKMQKLADLKAKVDADQIEPVDMIVHIVKHRLFDPREIAGMISILPIEKQIELAEKLTTDADILASMPPEAKPMHDKLVNSLKSTLGVAKEAHDLLKSQTAPSNRIQKYL